MKKFALLTFILGLLTAQLSFAQVADNTTDNNTTQNPVETKNNTSDNVTDAEPTK